MSENTTPAMRAAPFGGLLGMVQNRQWGRLFPVSCLRIPVFIVAALLARKTRRCGPAGHP